MYKYFNLENLSLSLFIVIPLVLIVSFLLSISNNQRLTVIESNRFTDSDARAIIETGIKTNLDRFESNEKRFLDLYEKMAKLKLENENLRKRIDFLEKETFKKDK